VSAVASPRRWTGDVIAITAEDAEPLSACDHRNMRLT
jgi:hypothetical protein